MQFSRLCYNKMAAQKTMKVAQMASAAANAVKLASSPATKTSATSKFIPHTRAASRHPQLILRKRDNPATQDNPTLAQNKPDAAYFDRVHPVLRGAPWVHRHEVASRSFLNELAPNSYVNVMVPFDNGSLICAGSAIVNTNSKIVARIFDHRLDWLLDSKEIQFKIQQSIARRLRSMGKERCEFCRIVNAEADGLPGLIIDRYGDIVVFSVGTKFFHDNITEVVKAIENALPNTIRVIVERSESSEVRRLEGISEDQVKQTKIWKGTDAGVERLKITEFGQNIWFSPLHGQKTGFYLDQYHNRRILRDILSRRIFTGTVRVLDLYSYVGAWSLSVHGLKSTSSGVHLTMVDSSELATTFARENMRNNKIPESSYEIFTEKVEDFLETSDVKKTQAPRKYDVIIVDPPPMASSRGTLPSSLTKMTHIYSSAMKQMSSSGVLVVASCSAAITRNMHDQVVAESARKAGVRAWLLARGGQGPDHWVRAGGHVGEYLNVSFWEIESRRW